MKTLFQTTITSRVALIILFGCLFSLGIFFFMLKGCGSAQKNTQVDFPTEQVETTAEPLEKETRQSDETKIVPETEKLTLSVEEARDIFMHRGHAHPDPGVDYTKIPESPPGDTFFPTIQFPTTPPNRPDGHYVPDKYPSSVPEFVTENPDRFFVDERGEWYIKYPPELEEKLDREVYLTGLKGDAFVKRYAEVVSEGLDTLSAAVFVLNAHLGDVGKAEAKVRFELVLAENPDDFYALLYLGGLIKQYEPVKAKVMIRRAVALRPESTLALSSLGRLIAHNYDTEAELREVIPYLEKSYRLNPEWYGPLLTLGEIYFSLKEYKKSLKYFQAVEVFTGGPGDTSSFYINFIKRGLANTAKQQGEQK